MDGRLKLGLVYYAAGRRDDAAAEWRAVLASDAETARPRCTWRCSTRPPRPTVVPDGHGNAGAVLTFTPSPEQFVVEEIPAYAPSGEGTHTFFGSRNAA